MNDIAPPIIISITTIFAKTIGSKQKQKRSNAIKAYGQNYCKTEYYCHKFMSRYQRKGICYSVHTETNNAVLLLLSLCINIANERKKKERILFFGFFFYILCILIKPNITLNF